MSESLGLRYGLGERGRLASGCLTLVRSWHDLVAGISSLLELAGGVDAGWTSDASFTTSPH